MRRLSILLLLSSLTLLSGCYAHFKAPSLHLAASYDAEGTDRTGGASCNQILWVFAVGDCSIQTAMRNGGISKLHHVDTENRMILFGAWSELTIQAYGE